MSDESDILDLIHQADTRQFERDINKLERLADVGDRIVAQQAVMIAAKKEAGSDPTQPNTE